MPIARNLKVVKLILARHIIELENGNILILILILIIETNKLNGRFFITRTQG